MVAPSSFRPWKTCPVARTRYLAFVGRAMIGPDATSRSISRWPADRRHHKLLVYRTNMLKNMNKFRGLVHSPACSSRLTQAGVSRGGCLPARTAQCHEGLGTGRIPRRTVADTEVRASSFRRGHPGEVSTSAIIPSTSTRFPAGFRFRLGGTETADPGMAHVFPCPHLTSFVQMRAKSFSVL